MLRKPWMGGKASEEAKDGASFLIAANVDTRMVGDTDEELSLLRQLSLVKDTAYGARLAVFTSLPLTSLNLTFLLYKWVK